MLYIINTHRDKTMKSSKDTSGSTVSLLLICALFLLILPALAAAAGSIMMFYIEGLHALPPIASRLAFAAAGMVAVSLITAKIMKAGRSFLKTPLILTLIGIVLVPLEAGLTDAFSPSDRPGTAVSEPVTAVMLHTDAIAQALLTVAPVALLGIAVFMMGGELADMVWQKFRGKKAAR